MRLDRYLFFIRLLKSRTQAQALLEEVHYVELSDRADFNDRFVDRLAFPV